MIVVRTYWKTFLLLFRTAKTSNMSKQLPVVHFKTYLNSNFSLLIIVGNPSFPKTPRGVSHVAANEFHWKLWKHKFPVKFCKAPGPFSDACKILVKLLIGVS